MKNIFYLTTAEEWAFICNHTKTDLSASQCKFFDHITFEEIILDIKDIHDGHHVVISDKLLEKSGIEEDYDSSAPYDLLKPSKYKLGRQFERYCEGKAVFFDELSKYIYYRTMTQISDYTELLDEFMPSREMAEFLKKPGISISNIADIIYSSPCPLDKKLTGLKKLSIILEESLETILKAKCDELIGNIESALALIDSEGVFTIESAKFVAENGENSNSFEGVYATWNHVLEYVGEDLKNNEINDDRLYWHEVTKWINNGNGRYIEGCSYILVRGKLWFICSDNNDERYGYNHFYTDVNLNLPVPFKAGDIVECDGYPFTPKAKLLILDVGDNLDCCCLRAIHLGESGRWDVGAVKHGIIGYDQYPQLSPLYTLRTFKEL